MQKDPVGSGPGAGRIFLDLSGVAGCVVVGAVDAVVCAAVDRVFVVGRSLHASTSIEFRGNTIIYGPGVGRIFLDLSGTAGCFVLVVGGGGD